MLIQPSFYPSDNRFTHFYPQIVRFLTAGGRYGKALGTGQCPVPGHLVTLGTPVLATSKNWPCTGHSILAESVTLQFPVRHCLQRGTLL